jgi:WD40 repeat protein
VAVGSAGRGPFGGHAGRVWSVAFRPGGFFVATGGDDGTIRIWDDANGEQRALLTGHSGPVYSVTYSPDAAVIASAGADHTVRIWDPGTGQQRAQLTGHSALVRSVAYNQTGTLLASAGDDRMVWIWDAGTGEQVRSLPSNPGVLKSVAFSPDGAILACAGRDLAVWLWEVYGDSEPRRLTGHTSAINTVAFSADGAAIASAGGDRLIRIWDAATGTQQKELRGHTRRVNAVAFSPDGTTVASAGDDDAVLVWSLGTFQILARLQGHQGPVYCVAYNTAGAAAAVASASADGTARIWDVASRRERQRLSGHTGPVNAVAYSPDGATIATAGDDRAIRIWDVSTGDQRACLIGHGGPLSALAYRPRSAELATVDRQDVWIWNVDNRRHRRLPNVHDDWVRAVAYSPDGQTFATASDEGTVLIWGMEKGNYTVRLSDRAGPVSSVALRPGGAVITGGRDGTVRVWEAGTSRIQAELYGNFGEVWSVASSANPADNTIAAAGSDGTVVIWDFITGEQLARLTGQAGPIYSMAYDPTGVEIATAGGDGMVRIWHVGTFTQRTQLTGHTSAVRSLAYSPDGAKIVTCGYDGTIRVWDASTGSQIAASISGSGFGESRPRSVPLAGVKSDSPSTIDLLGVDRDVKTLAELIAAARTNTPLAIALIGAWGAGKSSVMQLVSAEIDRLVELSRNNRGATAFATSVCQIPFNAWHYSSDQLWASVARNMFQALSRSGQSGAGEAADQDLSAERAQLQAELAECADGIKRLTAELDQARQVQPPAGFLRSLSSPSYMAKVFASSYRELRADSRTSWEVLVGWLVLAGIAAGAWWLSRSPDVRVGVLVVAGTLGPLLPVLRQLQTWHQLLTSKADELLADLEQQKADLERKMAEAAKQLEVVDALFRFGVFVQDRGDSAVYRDGRGLIGSVHDDLLLLRENLRAARREWTGGDEGEEPPERIVLYIDDLDRCPPDQVVQMLEAVHLMLTLDLFVVVVAVDARWMIRSLEYHYRAFFGTDRAAVAAAAIPAAPDENLIAPYDYLDKIFQIPYTLVPPTGARAAGYMRKLLPEPRLATGLRSHNGEAAEPTGSSASAATSAASSRVGLDRGQQASSATAQQGKLDSSSDKQAADGNGGDENGTNQQSAVSQIVTDLQPPSLRLSHAEVEFMTRLSSLAPWPRAAKRMANIYQLVRISIPDEKLTTFLGDMRGGSYRVVQVLIAILAGSPGSACEIYMRILAADPGADLLDVLGSDSEGLGKASPIAGICAKLRHLHDEYDLPLNVAEYRKWCPELARYSFRTWSLARGLAEEAL